MTKEKVLEILKNPENFIRAHSQEDGDTINLFEGYYVRDVKPEVFNEVINNLKIVKDNCIEIPFLGVIRDTEYKLK